MTFTKSVYTAHVLYSLGSPSNALSEPIGSYSRSMAFNFKNMVSSYMTVMACLVTIHWEKLFFKISYEISSPFKQMTYFINHNICICERHMTYSVPRQCGPERGWWVDSLCLKPVAPSSISSFGTAHGKVVAIWYKSSRGTMSKVNLESS